jgi:hypothetical protein
MRQSAGGAYAMESGVVAAALELEVAGAERDDELAPVGDVGVEALEGDVPPPHATHVRTLSATAAPVSHRIAARVCSSQRSGRNVADMRGFAV